MPRSWLANGVRLGVILLPGFLLLGAALRMLHPLLWCGVALQIGISAFVLGRPQNWRQPLGGWVFVLYLTALAYLWVASILLNDWLLSLAHAALLVVSIAAFSVEVLRESGALEMRRAQLLARRLAERQHWPADLPACRMLAEVKALRDAIHLDPTPALVLLTNPRPEVQMAALAALEFRKHWRPNQAGLLLQVARESEEPTVRAAAIQALGNGQERSLIEALAESLRDLSAEVRRAAAEALLWDSERRWSWIRHAVHDALADSRFQDDGPLLHAGRLLCAEAINDLTAWASRKGILSVRAVATLEAHYRAALEGPPNRVLLEDLKRELANPQAPAALRTVLAQLLQARRLLDTGLLEQLLAPVNPVPLRLVAAQSLLGEGEHAGAIAALRDIARLPNREIALATADVVQRHLQIDLGLALDQPLPPVHSRLAAEVTRRVMHWASGKDLRATTCEPALR